jgi:hypothetical protein
MQVSIVWGVFVPLRAVCYAGMAGFRDLWRVAKNYIIPLCDDLKVRRVDTTPDAALVINN